MTVIDLSRNIVDDLPVFPGDMPTKLEQTHHLELDGFVNHYLQTGMHTGTHIDGPLHLTKQGDRINSIPLEKCMGKGVLLDGRGESSIAYKPAYEDLIPKNSISLFYTGWDERFGAEEYFDSHPILTEDLAHFLIGRGVKAVGVDTPSPDRFPFPVHKLLLSHGVLIIENLTNLETLLGVKNFEVWALPLKIDADSSPIRAAARILD